MGFCRRVMVCSCCFVIGSIAAASPSPQGLTIDQAISEAQSKSPKVQRARAAAQESDWHRVETLSGFLPSVSANAYHLMGINYQLVDMNFNGAPMTIAQVLPDTNVIFSANLPVFDGFANVNRFQAARFSARAARLEADWAEFEVGQEVSVQFMRALAAGEAAKVNDQNVKTLEDHLAKMQALRSGGAATNYDVLRVEVQLNEARAEQMQSQDNMILTRQALNELLDVSDDERGLAGTIPEPAVALTRDLKPEALEKRPDLQAVSERESAALKEDMAAAAFWVPKVSLGGQYIYYNSRDNSVWNGGQYRDAYQVGIYLTWNIFDGMASIARSYQAAYRLDQINRSSREKQLHAPYDFQFWKRRYEYLASLYQSKKMGVLKAEESVRLAAEGLRAGTRTSTEMLDAELDLFRERAGVVSAQSNAAEALYKLESAIGRKISHVK